MILADNNFFVFIMESKLAVSSMTGEGNSLQEVLMWQATHLEGGTKKLTQVKYEREYLTLQTTTILNQFKVLEAYIARVLTDLNNSLLKSILTEKIRINLLY